MLGISIVIHDTPSTTVEGAVFSILNNYRLLCDNRHSAANVLKLYILDNSNNGDYAYLAEKSPLIDYRRIPNKGFGASHNIAIREILGEKKPIETSWSPSSPGSTHNLRACDQNQISGLYHLVLNPDVYWEGDILTPMIDFMESNPDVGLIAPKVLNPDGSLQYTARNLPSPLDLFANRFLPEFLCKKRLDNFLMRNEDPDKPRNVPYLMGCFMLFRDSALRDCGIFDERFFLYPEDIDITRRINQKYKTLYWPEVSVFHEHTRGSSRSLRLFLIHFYNMFLYFHKWN